MSCTYYSVTFTNHLDPRSLYDCSSARPRPRSRVAALQTASSFCSICEHPTASGREQTHKRRDRDALCVHLVHNASGVLGALSFGAMATVASGTTEALLFANLVASAAVALSDVVVDSLVVEKARDEAEAASTHYGTCVGLVSRVAGDDPDEDDEDWEDDDEAPVPDDHAEVCWLHADGTRVETTPNAKLRVLDRAFIHGDVVARAANALGIQGVVVGVNVDAEAAVQATRRRRGVRAQGVRASNAGAAAGCASSAAARSASISCHPRHPRDSSRFAK